MNVTVETMQVRFVVDVDPDDSLSEVRDKVTVEAGRKMLEVVNRGTSCLIGMSIEQDIKP